MGINTIGSNDQLILKSANAQNSVQKAKVEEDAVFEETSVKETESKFSCTDSADDGKISFTEGTFTFLKGLGGKLVDQVKNAVESVVKHPKETLLAVGATVGVTAIASVALASALGIALAPAAGIVGGALGLIAGGVQVFKGVKNFISDLKESRNATTDAEAKQALYDMGGDTLETLEGVGTMVVSGSTLTKNAASVATYSAAKKGLKVMAKEMEPGSARYSSLNDAEISAFRARVSAVGRNEATKIIDSFWKDMDESDWFVYEYTEYEPGIFSSSILDPSCSHIPETIIATTMATDEVQDLLIEDTEKY